MLDRYIDFINQHISDTYSQKLLLGVSGGADSMVMLDLSIKANLSIAVAHVNHDMRGSESDTDEILVRELCSKHHIPFHLYKFNSTEKAANNFQERARDIRYKWWKELCQTEDYSHILTAHHSSDRVETFFLNLMRGAGIRGLSSIPTVNQNILRPLSYISKRHILEYAAFNNVTFREDLSNQESKYTRNWIRNDWLPFLRIREPNIENAITKSIVNLSKENTLLHELVEKVIKDVIITQDTGYQLINTDHLINNYNNKTSQLLYQYLSQFGFTEDNCTKCITAVVGSEFHSETHDLLRDRGCIILRVKTRFKPISLEISHVGEYQLDQNTKLLISQEISNGCLSISGLTFPFTIRHKRSGDKFCPSGMLGSTQKIKDFLTNAKLDKWSKQNTLVVDHQDTIAAVLPLRVSHEYKENGARSKLYISIQYH